MKKLFAVLMALMVLCFTQCKPVPEGGDDEVRMVKISCTIPLNNGNRSDFTNLMSDGLVNWSNGTERVYLAIPGANHQIIELAAVAEGNPSLLEFTGEAAEGLVTPGNYDIWYFGHSQQTYTPYVSLKADGSKLEGSIAKQSGRLKDLGYCHIAKTTVKAVLDDGNVRLNLTGILESQVAIVLMDLTYVDELYGEAIVGTEYALEYNGSNYELNVTPDSEAVIDVEKSGGISYIALFPNSKKGATINYKQIISSYEYKFHKGIDANKVYYRYASDGLSPEALKWSKIAEDGSVNLGLSVKWASCNVGADSPEEYGEYYAWGEIETKANFSTNNSLSYNKDIPDYSGNPTYDVAAAKWGGTWRTPTMSEFEELVTKCTWTWTEQNGIKGCLVTGPSGKSIFLPAAGYNHDEYLNTKGFYWSSTPSSKFVDKALKFNGPSGNVPLKIITNETGACSFGYTVRPVCD